MDGLHDQRDCGGRVRMGARCLEPVQWGRLSLRARRLGQDRPGHGAEHRQLGRFPVGGGAEGVVEPRVVCAQSRIRRAVFRSRFHRDPDAASGAGFAATPNIGGRFHVHVRCITRLRLRGASESIGTRLADIPLARRRNGAQAPHGARRHRRRRQRRDGARRRLPREAWRHFRSGSLWRGRRAVVGTLDPLP